MQAIIKLSKLNTLNKSLYNKNMTNLLIKKIENLNKKLLITVPYRDREIQYKTFLNHIKMYFNTDKIDKFINVKVCFLEQDNKKPFNLGSLNNAGYLINESYLDYIVINNVDFLPMLSDYSFSENPTLLIKFGFNNLPMKPSKKDCKLIIKAPNIENVFLGSVLLPKNIFKKVNGYSNSFWGWGFEDTDMKKRLDKNKIKIEYRDGVYQPLFHDNLGYEVDDNNNSKPSKYHMENQKIFEKKWKNVKNYLEDGINNFKFKINSNEEIYKNSRFGSIFEIRHIKIDF